jgi:dimethylsulfone monooxygenase
MPRDTSVAGRLTFHSRHAFKLGIFGANCSNGSSFVTNAPERWTATWDDCLALAEMADRAGVDFILPLARWKGYGGEIDFQGTTHETLTWATALLAKTRNISVFATTHVPLYHPIVAAKQMVVADLVSEGRFGLNIVCGWNEGEFDMFGATLREHEERYAYAQEWIDIVLMLWGPQDDFDFDGQFFKLKKVRGKPKPYDGARPIFMNAGLSTTGQAFAVRNCDAFFSRMRPEFLAEDAARMKQVRDAAVALGRKVESFAAGAIVCRPTKAQAMDYIRRCTEEYVDWGAVDGLVSTWGAIKSPEEQDRIRKRAAFGMANTYIAGSPDDVANDLELIYRAGAAGYAAIFVNYLDELPYFCAEVIPRLERKGMRVEHRLKPAVQ